jgi:hypothetical protein
LPFRAIRFVLTEHSLHDVHSGAGAAKDPASGKEEGFVGEADGGGGGDGGGGDCIVHVHTVEARPARYGELRADLQPRLQDMLR